MRMSSPIERRFGNAYVENLSWEIPDLYLLKLYHHSAILPSKCDVDMNTPPPQKIFPKLQQLTQKMLKMKVGRDRVAGTVDDVSTAKKIYKSRSLINYQKAF